MSCERTGKVPRIATAIATSPSDELFVLFSNGELWRLYYLPMQLGPDNNMRVTRKWERLDLPNPPPDA